MCQRGCEKMPISMIVANLPGRWAAVPIRSAPRGPVAMSGGRSMMDRCKTKLTLAVVAVCGLCLGAAGCLSHEQALLPEDAPLPRELAKTSLPPYVVETPDILLIDAVRIVPRPPYRVQPLDSLLV